MLTKVSNTPDAAYETGTKREIEAALIRTKSGPFEFETPPRLSRQNSVKIVLFSATSTFRSTDYSRSPAPCEGCPTADEGIVKANMSGTGRFICHLQTKSNATETFLESSGS
jgi:hypothetical protein